MISLLQNLSDDNPSEPNAEWEIKSNWIYDELRMLFDSRPRIPGMEENTLLNGTILNYGLDESEIARNAQQSRPEVMQQRIAQMLQRFDSRLTEVNVQIQQSQLPCVEFIIQAQWQQETLNFVLVWDDGMSIFYLNESF